MKEFNLELAKAGHQVQTRDGRPARVICYDKNGDKYPIIALISNEGKETPCLYDINGRHYIFGGNDLVMVSTKKEGWINIYPKENYVGHISNAYETEEEALKERRPDCLATKKIEWEE